MNFQKLSVFNNQTRKKLNRPTTSIEIESVIIKKKLLPILLKLFQKTEEEGTPPNSFCETITTLIPNQETKKENYRSISLINKEVLNKILAKFNNT